MYDSLNDRELLCFTLTLDTTATKFFTEGLARKATEFKSLMNSLLLCLFILISQVNTDP